MAREPTTRQLAASLASGALSGRGAMVSLMIDPVKTLAVQIPRRAQPCTGFIASRNA